MALIIQGRNPSGVGEKAFKISDKKADATRYGPEQQYSELVHTLPLVMKEPMAIFQGLKREGYERGLCFSGKTDRYWISQSIETPFPPGKVFTVYINEDQCIFVWRLEREDGKDAGHPIRWEERFTKRIWPH